MITGRVLPWTAIDTLTFTVTVPCFVTSVATKTDFSTLYYSIRLGLMTIDMP